MKKILAISLLITISSAIYFVTKSSPEEIIDLKENDNVETTYQELILSENESKTLATKKQIINKEISKEGSDVVAEKEVKTQDTLDPISDTDNVVDIFENESYISEWGDNAQTGVNVTFQNEELLTELAEKNLYFNYVACKSTVCKVEFSYNRASYDDPILDGALAADRGLFLAVKLSEKEPDLISLTDFNSVVDPKNGTFDFYLNKPDTP